jgi:predicted O-methyltransferase YrrM
VILPDIPTSISPAEAARLIELARDARVLEIGSWWGFSTVAMAQVARHVVAVDHHRGDDHAGHDESLRPLVANLERFDVRDSVTVMIGRSASVLPRLERSQYDLAFIDAYHTTEAVLEDARLVMPLVRKGGKIAFHDYGRFGVKEAVDDLFDRIELTETLAVVTR